jgi:hypothetical protein
MRNELAKLARNLTAGLRLALFLRVARLSFRVDVAQLLILFALSALLDVGADWVRYGPDAHFSWLGAGNELFSGALMMLTSALLALALRQPHLAVTIPVLALSAYPLLLVALTVPAAVQRWAQLPLLDLPMVWLVLGWVVLVLVRAVAVALAPRPRLAWPKALAGGLVLAAPIWYSPLLTNTETWWRQPSIHGVMDPNYPSAASEAVLTGQQDLLDDALAELDDERAGRTDLYFVGFAGDGTEDVFRRDVLAAQRVMDERWDTSGRSIALINSPRTLLDTPMATVTHLRAVLEEIAAAINPAEDVVMLYLSSHGRPREFQVSMPPLELAPITPPVLRKLLDDSGIRWRIVVVSACYSGSFVDALADEQTLVVTASQADRTSFGCGHQSASTYFGEAFFEQGMAKSDTVLGAFEIAQKRVAEREARNRVSPPSNPQISVGKEMASKLRELERGRAARGAGRPA